MTRVVVLKPEGFDWDRGNKEKNWEKHKVSSLECEEIFFNSPIKFFIDNGHSGSEDRFMVFGITSGGRRLAITITFRNRKVRVISARDQNTKERRLYEKT